MTTLHLLCAGAAQGLVKAMQARLEQGSGATLAGRFGAVGAMKEALLAGEPCDLMIVTDKMVAELVASGALRGERRAAIGRVRTGVAVRRGEKRPPIDTPEDLRQALLAAPAIYFPDPQRATAGIHFAGVLQQLGVADALAARLRTFPNGATAMRELAGAAPAGSIGCTQVSEILYTDGVELVGALPARFELSTLYSGAVAARAAQPELAARWLDMLAGATARDLRHAGGFED